ncbi:hypothetical protein [Pedobacter frigoris]|uniref:DoxX family protein n=1 Tax=Pedobacter frigoris TaxID=2571272 RepID=A0A4U1CNW6_9SPHI|nr:hypothetical protein [Pedobacter frigoris]TKC09651.1 hypothetical protein FA047_06095 [Pedobacter frigoris]
MEDTVHRNFKLAAYIIFASVLIDLTGGFIQYNNNPNFDITTTVEVSLLFMTFGYFTILGKSWIKWVILMVTILSIFPLITSKEAFSNASPFHISQVFSGFLKITSFFVLLFVPQEK